MSDMENLLFVELQAMANNSKADMNQSHTPGRTNTGRGHGRYPSGCRGRSGKRGGGGVGCGRNAVVRNAGRAEIDAGRVDWERLVGQGHARLAG
eukprot:scaffold108_cov96-Cylindrotheca_fusiformis.AAC.2